MYWLSDDGGETISLSLRVSPPPLSSPRVVIRVRVCVCDWFTRSHLAAALPAEPEEAVGPV